MASRLTMRLARRAGITPLLAAPRIARSAVLRCSAAALASPPSVARRKRLTNVRVRLRISRLRSVRLAV